MKINKIPEAADAAGRQKILVMKDYMHKDIQLSFTDKEITPWGGMSLMSRLLRKMDFQGTLQGVGYRFRDRIVDMHRGN